VMDKASQRSLVVENVAVVAVDSAASVITVLVNPQENDKILAAAAENRVTLAPHRGF